MWAFNNPALLAMGVMTDAPHTLEITGFGPNNMNLRIHPHPDQSYICSLLKLLHLKWQQMYCMHIIMSPQVLAVEFGVIGLGAIHNSAKACHADIAGVHCTCMDYMVTIVL